jgi:SAM-dependent methyltransferase
MTEKVKKYTKNNSKILELGGGYNRLDIPNVTELDIKKINEKDIIWNLEKTPLPFKNNTFDVVFSCSVLEHVVNILPLFEDLHRILKPRGKLISYVPHFAGMTSTHFLHRNYFSANCFGLFIPSNKDFNFETKARFNMLERKITFRTCFKPIELFVNINESTQTIYEGSVLKNIFPPQLILTVMEAVK